MSKTLANNLHEISDQQDCSKDFGHVHTSAFELCFCCVKNTVIGLVMEFKLDINVHTSAFL